MLQVSLYAEPSLNQTRYPQQSPLKMRAPRPTLRERLASATRRLRAHPVEQLSDSLLHDIGLTRADLCALAL